MRCPYCEDPSTKVVDSRPMPEGIRRRRECIACGRRFTTHERLAPVEIRVAKAGGRPVEAFDVEKIADAVARAGGGNALGLDAARTLARQIEAELVDAGQAAVTSGEIAERVLERLRALDRLAAVRFAADYTDLEGNLAFPRPAPRAPGEEDEEEQIGLFE